MSEQLLRDLEIGEDLQTEIRETLEHNNQSYFDWCDISDRGEIRTRLNLPLHIIWDGRRYNLVGDMTPIAGIP